MWNNQQRRLCDRLVSALLFGWCSLSAGLPQSSGDKLPRERKKPAPKKDLSKEIAAVLTQPPLNRAHWGVDVVDLDTGKALYSQNSDQLFLPASNAKLFTTAAALAIAGPDYRFRTTVEAEGKIDDNGRLLGDLAIVGPRRSQYFRPRVAVCVENAAHASTHADSGRDG